VTAGESCRWLQSNLVRQGEFIVRGVSVFVNVTFYGVRGSTPCSCDSNQRYGGNTSCVALEVPGHEPIVLDLGTGLRFFGQTQPTDGSFRGHALVTHLHWDHVQGLPFFVPVHVPGSGLDIYGPPQVDGFSLGEAFEAFMRPPYFPVCVGDLGGDIRFHTLDDGNHAVGAAEVRVRQVPHIGPTNGYRVELGGVSVAYVPDHQQPLDGSHEIAESVLELCDGADLLIHDAQFTPAEFVVKADWGHCTVDYALAVAAEAGVRRLALFHHDPSHDDAAVDRIHGDIADKASRTGVEEVIAAAEGLTVSFGAVPAAVAGVAGA
jgi:phosphoribosyl 1,2-cyclic phosphodiesterase